MSEVIQDAQLLAQFSQAYRSAVDAFMEQAGMYRGQALLLCTINKQAGMTQTEIADMLAVQGATVSHMLQRLEEARLVVRQRDAADNRLVRVYATEAGRQKELEIQEQLRCLEDAVLKGIGPAERETLRRLVWQMMDNISGESQVNP